MRNFDVITQFVWLLSGKIQASRFKGPFAAILIFGLLSLEIEARVFESAEGSKISGELVHVGSGAAEIVEDNSGTVLKIPFQRFSKNEQSLIRSLTTQFPWLIADRNATRVFSDSKGHEIRGIPRSIDFKGQYLDLLIASYGARKVKVRGQLVHVDLRSGAVVLREGSGLLLRLSLQNFGQNEQSRIRAEARRHSWLTMDDPSPGVDIASSLFRRPTPPPFMSSPGVDFEGQYERPPEDQRTVNVMELSAQDQVYVQEQAYLARQMCGRSLPFDKPYEFS